MKKITSAFTKKGFLLTVWVANGILLVASILTVLVSLLALIYTLIFEFSTVVDTLHLTLMLNGEGINDVITVTAPMAAAYSIIIYSGIVYYLSDFYSKSRKAYREYQKPDNRSVILDLSGKRIER